MVNNIGDFFRELESESEKSPNYLNFSIFIKQFKVDFEGTTHLEDLQKVQWEIDFFSFVLYNGKLNPCARFTNSAGELKELPSFDLFNDSTYNYLERRLNSCVNSLLKARYAHILWESPRKNGKFAQIAIIEYLNLLRLLEEVDKKEPDGHAGHDILIYIKTIYDLSCKINDQFDLVRCEVLRLLHTFNPKSTFYYKMKIDLITLIIEDSKIFSKDCYPKLKSICRDCGEDLFKKGQIHFAISFFEIGEKIDIKLGNRDNSWRERIAQGYETLMNTRLKNDDYIAACSFCLDALREYKTAKNAEKIAELSTIYSQIKNKGEYAQFSQEIPLADYAANCRQFARDLSRNDVSEIIAFLTYSKTILPNYRIIKERAEHFDEVYVGRKLMPITVIDQHGNPSKIYTTDEQKAEYTLLEQFKHDLSILTPIFLEEIIIKAIDEGKLNSDSILKFFIYYSWIGKNFQRLVPNNPPMTYNWLQLIKPSLDHFFNEISIQRLYPTYEPNFILFIDSLILKIEGILREFGQIHGIPSFKSKPDGTVQEKHLDELLREVKLKEFFYDEEILFFRIILIEKSGYNLRNRVGHALIVSQEYNRIYAYYLLLILLRICGIRRAIFTFTRWEPFSELELFDALSQAFNSDME